MIGDGELGKLLNRHVFKFSRLYGYNASFFCNFSIIIYSREMSVDAQKLQLFNFISFFCTQLLYYWNIEFPKWTRIHFFYLHYCYFYHLIYFGTCRMFNRTFFFEVTFALHWIKSNWITFACWNHWNINQIKSVFLWLSFFTTSIMHEHGQAVLIRKAIA